MSDTKYLNVQALKEHFDRDEEMIGELVEIFESTYVDILNDTKSAVETKSFSELEHAAHTLKGMIANFFADDLKVSAQELEKMGRQSELVEADAHIENLISGIPVLIDELKNI